MLHTSTTTSYPPTTGDVINRPANLITCSWCHSMVAWKSASVSHKPNDAILPFWRSTRRRTLLNPFRCWTDGITVSRQSSIASSNLSDGMKPATSLAVSSTGFTCCLLDERKIWWWRTSLFVSRMTVTSLTLKLERFYQAALPAATITLCITSKPRSPSNTARVSCTSLQIFLRSA